MNISFEYLYRDAGNNKIWSNVIFSNKTDIDLGKLDTDIKNALIDGEFFVAKEVAIPVLRFERYDEDLDHGWHEYFSVIKTDEYPNDEMSRDISEFLEMLKISQLRNKIIISTKLD
jgi:hypothetical protein